jgi:hypothetical protein
MPIPTTTISSDGPVIEIGIGQSAARIAALRAASQPVSAPVITRGLIDTGASCTCIDPEIVARLGLVPTGVCQMFSASSDTTPDLCMQYDVALAIFVDSQQVHSASFTIPVVERPLKGHGFQALIERDVLAHGVLIYHGKAGSLSLSF